MLYYFFDWLHNLHVPGTGAFLYTSTRVALSFLLSLILTFVLGKKIIRFLQKKQIGDTIRELWIEGQTKKIGTPTMGGIIIILSIVIPSLLLGRLNNLYLWLLIVTTLWLGGVGLIDDYIKVFKHNKEGIPAWGKLFGQIVLGIAIGGVLYFSPQSPLETPKSENSTHTEITTSKVSNKVKTLDTTVPFFKNHNFNYSYIVPSCLKEYAEPVGWFFFIVMSVLVITSVSNGVNMTDGLDGLATGCSAIVGAVLLLLTYVGTHTGISSYLNIMYIPQSEEIVIFLGTFVGATVAFLWFNAYPAQVFMGDTGSLSIGGIIAVVALLIRKELLLPLLCGIFLVESLSVILQFFYFKYTKKKYGEGRRIFKMAPLHHHFQKPAGEVNALIQKPFQPTTEPKIVIRFWLVSIFLAILTLVTLKLR